MKNAKNWIWLFLFGTIWGLAEVFVGKSPLGKSLPSASVWLSAFALLILAVARGFINKPASSTVVGAFAVLFRQANAAPFYCQLIGIFTVGVVFDLVCSALIRGERRTPIQDGFAGVASAYGSNLLFVFLMIFIVHYHPWVAGGWPRASHHIFVSGSWTALAAAVLVPLGIILGTVGRRHAERRPAWAWLGVVGIIIGWVLGRVVAS